MNWQKTKALYKSSNKAGRKILITGADGFIGRKLFAKIRDMEPIGTKYIFKDDLQDDNLYEIDLRNQALVSDFIRRHNPDVVIHLAALVSPEINEKYPELARESHILITSNIISNIRKDTQVIFLSTDKVFDGVHPYPDEEAATSPKYLYGKLKLDCENMIREKFEKYHILRLPIVHSLGDPVSVSFVDKALLNLKEGKSVNAFDNVSRCYIRVNDLVDLLAQLVRNNNYGIYHVGTVMGDYFSRIKQLCEEQKIPWLGKLTPKKGKAVPMVQNLNTEKLKNIFQVSLK